MRIFNQDKTIELTEYDLTKGYLKPDVIEIEIPEQSAIEEISHYETVKVYKNGGRDVVRVIDVEGRPHVPAHIDTEKISVYIPYTERELEVMAAHQEMDKLKECLRASDYKAIKFAEGVITAEEYAPDRAQRQAWRERIGELEIIIGGDV